MASAHPSLPFAERQAATSAWSLLTKRWLILPALLVALSIAGWWIPLNNDVSWQYWIARQMRGGAVLYSDIVEVNPPLWFWEAVPISALADRLHIDASHLVVVSVMARVVAALALVAKLTDDRAPRRIVLLLAGLALLLCLLPVADFGEREHLMLIGAIPYTALLARRREGRIVSTGLAACIGLFAAYGFAMKPHFALIPMLLEAWLAVGLRRSWRPLRPETVALATFAVAYVAALLRFAPDYLTATLPLVRAAYGAFSPPFSWLLSRQAWTPMWLFASLALAFHRQALSVDTRAAIVAALAMAGDYFLQGKGFSYHALPVTAMLGWALLWLLADSDDIVSTLARRPLISVALMLLAGTACFIGTFHPIRAGRATVALERLPAGSVVAVISSHSWLAFPLVEKRRLVWPLGAMSLWMLPKIAREENGQPASPGEPDLRRLTLDMLATDLWCHPPDAILMDDPARSPAFLRGDRFSYEAFVRSDARLRDLLAHYRPALSDAGATVYAKRAPIAPLSMNCRAISIRPDYR